MCHEIHHYHICDPTKYRVEPVVCSLLVESWEDPAVQSLADVQKLVRSCPTYELERVEYDRKCKECDVRKERRREEARRRSQEECEDRRWTEKDARRVEGDRRWRMEEERRREEERKKHCTVM